MTIERGNVERWHTHQVAKEIYVNCNIRGKLFPLQQGLQPPGIYFNSMLQMRFQFGFKSELDTWSLVVLENRFSISGLNIGKANKQLADIL